MIPFVKYHGTGNDFILIDDRKSKYDFKKEDIRNFCDRHFGIGADGLILLRNSNKYDFEMLYYNSDGLEGSMCGNGGRCVTAFAHTLGMIDTKAKFSAFDGVHESQIISVKPYVIKLHMNDVKTIEKNPDFVFLNTGSPHYVCFKDNVNEIDIINEGRKIRYNERFKKEGTNVNFVNVSDSGLFVRTYERGVEDETLSCGTGVTAAVLAASASEKNVKSGCKVQTKGGMLAVFFNLEGNGFSDIWLEGKAEEVFKGEIN